MINKDKDTSELEIAIPDRYNVVFGLTENDQVTCMIAKDGEFIKDFKTATKEDRENLKMLILSCQTMFCKVCDQFDGAEHNTLTSTSKTKKKKTLTFS